MRTNKLKLHAGTKQARAFELPSEKSLILALTRTLLCFETLLSCYYVLIISLGFVLFFRRPLEFPLILINIQTCA